MKRYWRYRKSKILTIYLILMGLVVALNVFGVLLFLLTPFYTSLVAVPTMSVVLTSFMFLAYMRMYIGRRPYVIYDEGLLSIDRAIFRRRAVIAIKEIKNKAIIGDELRMSDTSGNECCVNLNHMNLDDAVEFREMMEI